MKPPAAGRSKFRECAGCLATLYCNAECQRADWAVHKLDCKALGEMYNRSAAVEADRAEGQRKPRQETKKDSGSGMTPIPGLAKHVLCLA